MQSGVIRYGDHVDTDVIIPARYLNTTDPEALAAHCMEDLDRDFSEKVKTRRIIVGGRNFGCGSSREHAPLAIKTAGVQCIVADSFARIFYRNAINIGLPIVECPAAAAEITDGQSVTIALEQGTITCEETGKVYRFASYPAFMQKIVTAGGLVNAVKEGAL